MTSVVDAASVGRGVGTAGSLAESALRWVLPLAAAASTVLGAAFLFESAAPLGPHSALSCFLISWGVAAGLVSIGSWRATARPTQVRGPAASPRWSTFSAGATTRVASVPSDGLIASFTHRGSEWRVPATAISPGDETWLSWLPRERQLLGADSQGAYRRAAYSPGLPGSLVAIPTRDRGVGRRPPMAPGDSGGPAPPTRQATVAGPSEDLWDSRSTSVDSSSPPARPRLSPYSEEELDRMFPPATRGRTTFLSSAPERVGVRAVPTEEWNDAPGFQRPPGDDTEALEPERPTLEVHPDAGAQDVSRAGRFIHDGSSPRLVSSLAPGPPDEPSIGDPPADELSREAANPVPPHLRGTGLLPRSGTRRPHPSPAGPGGQKSVCASCSKVVVNLRMSGPCPRCLRPICNECLREAFVTHGHGWCIDCAASPAAAAAS